MIIIFPVRNKAVAIFSQVCVKNSVPWADNPPPPPTPGQTPPDSHCILLECFLVHRCVFHCYQYFIDLEATCANNNLNVCELAYLACYVSNILWILYCRGRVWVHQPSLSSGHCRINVSAVADPVFLFVYICKWVEGKQATAKWMFRQWPSVKKKPKSNILPNFL